MIGREATRSKLEAECAKDASSVLVFFVLLHFAMSDWRERVRGNGFDLEDGGLSLIDLRFADDILLFARNADESAWLLDSLVEELSKVGLVLNAEKTVALVPVQPESFPPCP